MKTKNDMIVFMPQNDLFEMFHFAFLHFERKILTNDVCF